MQYKFYVKKFKETTRLTPHMKDIIKDRAILDFEDGTPLSDDEALEWFSMEKDIPKELANDAAIYYILSYYNVGCDDDYLDEAFRRAKKEKRLKEMNRLFLQTQKLRENINYVNNLNFEGLDLNDLIDAFLSFMEWYNGFDVEEFDRRVEFNYKKLNHSIDEENRHNYALIDTIKSIIHNNFLREDDLIDAIEAWSRSNFNRPHYVVLLKALIGRNLKEEAFRRIKRGKRLKEMNWKGLQSDDNYELTKDDILTGVREEAYDFPTDYDIDLYTLPEKYHSLIDDSY